MRIAIEPSHEGNMEAFSHYWNSAVAYQQANRLPSWPSFPEPTIRAEIRDGLHFQATYEGQILGYFSLALNDPIIWQDLEKGDAIYIHRICVNPSIRGQKLASRVFDWACSYCTSLGRKYVRMDTWASNKGLIDYYEKCGFRVLKFKQLGVMPELPSHYSNIELVMFQNENH